ncbi:hypothetical protein [Haloarchaeobius sp. FL176]|uniref:hypothetical protein n=1 Tax=Haloarchaeobius sp. FL176 TaxID=2967129 RepID=UPI0021479076|nr:hypothetical protein [Haloarchaeobius sp. FL176]
MSETPLTTARSRRALRRTGVGLLGVLLVLTAFAGGASAAQPIERSELQSTQTPDDCDILLDPGPDAGYDTHIRGYSGASNSYTVVLTFDMDAVPCTEENANRLRAMLSSLGT